MKSPSRRQFLKASALATGASLTSRLWQSRALAEQVPYTTYPSEPTSRNIAPGPFQSTWESHVKNYQVPEWYRDAKFGMWAHWTAQCVPEQGDW